VDVDVLLFRPRRAKQRPIVQARNLEQHGRRLAVVSCVTARVVRALCTGGATPCGLASLAVRRTGLGLFDYVAGL
jgi:hypothetical protein